MENVHSQFSKDEILRNEAYESSGSRQKRYEFYFCVSPLACVLCLAPFIYAAGTKDEDNPDGIGIDVGF